jgi:cytidine deaminase
MSIQLTDPEDAKLLTLARASRSRARAAGAAAVRDTDGRTYTAADIDLPSLQLSALQVAVAMAISSGVEGLEAGLVMTDALALDELDVTVVREFAGEGIVLYRATSDGTVVDSTTT